MTDCCNKERQRSKMQSSQVRSVLCAMVTDNVSKLVYTSGSRMLSVEIVKKLVINSNLGPILPRFRDIVGFLLKKQPHPIIPHFWVLPWTRLQMLGTREAKTLS